jgi:uncharacterized protein
MELSVVVKPGSKSPGMTVVDGTIVLRVRERAIDGAANAACIRALAASLRVAPSTIVLLHGERGRHKRFAIAALTATQAHERLRDYLTRTGSSGDA